MGLPGDVCLIGVQQGWNLIDILNWGGSMVPRETGAALSRRGKGGWQM